MDLQTRAELIAALVTDRYSEFRDGDEAILEAASDARLEELRDGSGEVPAKARHASSVRHEGGLWVLYSTNGSRRLGTYSTKEEAESHEQAIALSLARQKAN